MMLMLDTQIKISFTMEKKDSTKLKVGVEKALEKFRKKKAMDPLI